MIQDLIRRINSPLEAMLDRSAGAVLYPLVEPAKSRKTERPIRRICLYGGPGAGKSTIAAYVFYHLKIGLYNVELVSEIAKKYAYEGIPIEGETQQKVFKEQQESEEFWLRHGVELVVTDSPLPLQAYYSWDRGENQWEGLLHKALEFERNYRSLNIWLDREGVPYQPFGRYQKDLGEAESVDQKLWNFLGPNGSGHPLTRLKAVDHSGIFRFVADNVNRPNA